MKNEFDRVFEEVGREGMEDMLTEAFVKEATEVVRKTKAAIKLRPQQTGIDKEVSEILIGIQEALHKAAMLASKVDLGLTVAVTAIMKGIVEGPHCIQEMAAKLSLIGIKHTGVVPVETLDEMEKAIGRLDEAGKKEAKTPKGTKVH